MICTQASDRIFSILAESGEIVGGAESVSALHRLSLYKTLSLLLARGAGLPVPATVLLLDNSQRAFDSAVGILGLPVLLRMDYQNLRGQKLLGGISIESIEPLQLACRCLWENGFFPLLQASIERDGDLYSIGILIDDSSDNTLAEIVGRGFDASDLRLGAAMPHEVISFSSRTGEVLTRSRIASNEYLLSRERRARARASLRKYNEFMNTKGLLLPSLESLKVSDNEVEKQLGAVPETYTPIDRDFTDYAADVVRRVRRSVAPYLPKSRALVVSMSLTQEHGWILWDIYGEWYRR